MSGRLKSCIAAGHLRGLPQILLKQSCAGISRRGASISIET
jgi:hypothetical protein